MRESAYSDAITTSVYGTTEIMFQRRALDEHYWFTVRDEWTTDETVGVVPLVALAMDKNPSGCDTLFSTKDALLLVCLRGRRVSIGIATKTRAASLALIEECKKWLPQPTVQEGRLDVTFWFHTANGPRSYSRRLDAPTWPNIAGNYPMKTSAPLESLITHIPSEESGKLILWRGQPGTGKTFMLRALGMAWRGWCDIHYILDPEVFLDEGGYLYQVALNNEDVPRDSTNGADDETKWRLIVLEDTGEILAKDAKERSGQRLSRLLNMCDGLLGQGSRVLFLITTNEDIGSLHAAVRRPGRCLSEVSFDAMPAGEASDWLAHHGSDQRRATSATVAELYALLDGRTFTEERAAAGFTLGGVR